MPVPAGRVLFFFIDGVGLGPEAETNPFTAARLPVLEGLLGGRRVLAGTPPGASAAGDAGVPRPSGPADTIDPTGAPDAGSVEPVRASGNATLLALDASHGVPGIPQSGTGHTTLLTGHDAVARFGRHYGPWVPTALRALVAEESILARAKAAGKRVAFANAYPEELLARVPDGVPIAEAVTSRKLGPLRSGPPLAALGAGVLTRHTPELAAGEAVASEIINDGWIAKLGRDLPVVAPEEAGANLARIAAAHDLTLFAHYTPDYVGHRGTWDEAVAALERVDAFLGGLLEDLPNDVLLIVASDHGNIEDVSAEHTLNPALGLVAGEGHGEVAGALRHLWDVAGVVLGRL